MTKYLSTLIFIILFSVTSHAAYIGTGCAVNDKAALEFALADLAAQVQVQVESEFNSYKSSSGADRASYKVRITTDIPIIGYKSKSYSQDGQICVDVSIDKSSIPAYENAVNRDINDINSYIQASKSAASDKEAQELLSRALSAYYSYEKYAAVLVFLRKVPKSPIYSRVAIEKMILKYETISSDVSIIAKNLYTQLEQDGYYIHPPKLVDSSAVTPFASLLMQEIKSGVISTESASKHLFCVYDPATDPFLIGCQVTENGKVLDSAITMVDRKVCETVECYQSANMNALEQAFQNKISTDGYRAHFYANRGSSPLIAYEDEVLRFYTRTGKASKLALYALDANGRGTMIQLRNNVSKANTETELVVLKVTAPFGDESLLLFAYENDLKTALPQDFDIKDIDKLRNAIKASNTNYAEEELIIHTRGAE